MNTPENSIFGDPERFAFAFHGMTFREFAEEVYKNYNENGKKLCAPGDQTKGAHN